MTTLTLMTKIYNSNQLKQVEKMLKRNFEGLDVEAKIEGVASDRWVQIAISGEDEAIATNFLAKEFGFCPVSLENVKKFSTLKGYVTNLEKSTDELLVDIGVFQPKTVNASMPLRHIQAQLADGKKLALKKMVELFGLSEDMPINVKVTTINNEENRIEAQLSTKQLEKFASWQESLLDKLIILGATAQEVKRTIAFTGLDRDIINIEPLGMFEHVLTCKLGTDAAGLISKIGRHLRNARFTVFNPRKIRALSAP
jgi:hypothetical protein